jgi:hypothetical protein
LADAVPGVETTATTVESELRIFAGKDLGLRCPEGMSYLKAVGGVGGTKLAGLDEEGEESGDKQEQGDRMRGCEAEHWSPWYVCGVRATSGFGVFGGAGGFGLEERVDGDLLVKAVDKSSKDFAAA